AGPPLSVSFSQSQVVQGTSVGFTIILPSAAYPGGMPLIVSLSGLGTGADTATVPVDTAGQPLEGTLSIPGGVPDGTLVLSVALPTLRDSASASLTILDTEAPAIGGAYVTSAFGQFAWGPHNMLIAGASDSVAIGASDNHALAWIGWRTTAPVAIGDSVQVNGVPSSTVSLPVSVATSLIGDTVNLTVFAKDEDGNVTSAPLNGYAVSAVTTHPTQSIQRGAGVSDVAFDSARGLLYLAKPDSQSVTVLSLSSMTYQAAISVSGTPVGLDLSPGGDSLIIGLSSPAALAIVSLSMASHPLLGTLPFDSSDVVDSLRAFRVMGDNSVFALVTHYNTPYQPTAAMSLSLTTGVSYGFDSSGHTYCDPHVVRSADRAVALALNCGGFNVQAFLSVIYTTATHAFNDGTYVNGLAGGNNVLTSGSAAASGLFQFGHGLVNANAGIVFNGGLDQYYGAAVAPNAMDFFVGEGLCSSAPCADSVPGLYLHCVLPGGTPTEIAVIPHPAYKLTVAPNGATMYGVAADSITAIDLTHSSLATSADMARLAHFLRRARGKPRSIVHSRLRGQSRAIQIGTLRLRSRL
ncbi:MAG TPA: hypothetical protein VK679_08870, partial [Gemmatimonadaceae bacterium]|nr:hypothetical protein [Gemmatimonadaceae bacterium]